MTTDYVFPAVLNIFNTPLAFSSVFMFSFLLISLDCCGHSLPLYLFLSSTSASGTITTSHVLEELF